MRNDVLMHGKRRFEAEWIAAQHIDNGEWNPRCDEYGHSHHATKEEAEQKAIRAGKSAANVEWILVAEQEYIGHEWLDIRRWTGDWDGLGEETFCRETDA